MVSKTRKSKLAAAIACALAIFATNMLAQEQSGGASHLPQPLVGQESRFAVIQQLGLNDPALRLATAQRAEIDKIILAYVAQQNMAIAKSPQKADGARGQEAMAARRSARDNLAASINKILNAQQRETWEAAKSARRTQMSSRNLDAVRQK